MHLPSNLGGWPGRGTGGGPMGLIPGAGTGGGGIGASTF